MFNRRIILLFSILMCVFVTANAQISTKRKSETTKEEAPSRYFFGGGIGGGYSNGWIFNISPFVGYKLTPKFWTGVGVDYYYANYKINPNFSDTKAKVVSLGPRVFGQYHFTKEFNAHAEYQYISFKSKVEGFETYKGNTNSILLGGGYTQRLGARSGVRFEALYDVLYDETSPDRFRSSPFIFRMNFITGI